MRGWCILVFDEAFGLFAKETSVAGRDVRASNAGL